MSRPVHVGQRYLIGALLAGFLILGVGLIAFDKNVVYAASYSASFVLVIAVSIGNVRRYGLPSWRAGIPLYYLMMFYVLPLYQQLTGFVNFLDTNAAPKAWLLGAAGMLAYQLTVVVFSAQAVHAHPRFRHVEDRWPLNRLASFSATVAVVAIGTAASLWAANYGYYGLQIVDADRRSTLSGIISSLTIFMDLGSVIACIKTFEPGERGPNELRRWALLAAITSAIALFFALYSNSKGAFLKPFLIAILAYFSVRRKLSISWLTALILGYVLVVYPFVSTFRLQYDRQGMSGPELLTQSIYHLTSLDWVYGRGAVAQPGDSEAFGSLGRGLFITFSTIVDTVDQGAILKGETLADAMSFLVPRALWPTKPEDTVGNLMGHFTGQILPSDTITNISPTQMGEFYANFGFLGLLLGMALWGWLSYVVDVIICRGRSGWMATFMFFQVLLQESPFGQGILSLVKALPVYILAAAAAAAFADLIERPRRRMHYQA